MLFLRLILIIPAIFEKNFGYIVIAPVCPSVRLSVRPSVRQISCKCISSFNFKDSFKILFAYVRGLYVDVHEYFGILQNALGAWRGAKKC